MFFCQILAAIEVLNAAFGVVRTGVIPTLIQVQVPLIPGCRYYVLHKLQCVTGDMSTFIIYYVRSFL